MPADNISAIGQGFWTPYEPVYTGFSVNPSGGICRFAIIGKTCILAHERLDGTSNATTFYLTLPDGIVAFSTYHAPGAATNNTALSATPGMAVVYNAVNTRIDVFRDWQATAWTASGTKNCKFTVMFEIV